MTAPETDTVIAATGLRKSYGAREAVRGVDLHVGRGDVVALLGPNGAGKTTLIELIAGLRERTAGDVRVLGVDPAVADAGWRERVGVVLQDSQPDPGLTVRECLDLYAGYYRAPRQPFEVADLVGLSGDLNVRTEQLSGGQRRGHRPGRRSRAALP